MVALAVTDVVGGVDDKVRGVNIVAFYSSLKQFRFVNSTVCLEPEDDILTKCKPVR